MYSKKKSGYVRYDYLQCSRAPRRKGGDGCKAKRVLGHKLEAAVFETLREACADDEVVSASLMELAKQHEKQLRQDDRRHKVLIRQRDRLKGQASKLMESFDADDLGLVKRKLSDLESRIEAVNLEIDEIEAKPPPVFPTPEQNRLIQEALEHFQVLYLQLTVPERRELFSIMFESIVWHSTHATVKLRGKSARKVPVGKGRYPLMDLLKEVPEGIEFRTQEVGGKKG